MKILSKTKRDLSWNSSKLPVQQRFTRTLTLASFRFFKNMFARITVYSMNTRFLDIFKTKQKSFSSNYTIYLRGGTRRKHTLSRGFTLLEMLVSVAIFTFVMLIGVGALLSMMDTNRKAQSVNASINNLNLALESMSRNIRVGTRYHCESSATSIPPDLGSAENCSAGGKLFGFEASDGSTAVTTDQVVYRLNSNTAGTDSWIEKSKDGGTTFLRVTAPTVFIEDLTFYVFGAVENNRQSRVIITIKGYAGTRLQTRTDFTLQTMVSQRIVGQ